MVWVKKKVQNIKGEWYYIQIGRLTWGVYLEKKLNRRRIRNGK